MDQINALFNNRGRFDLNAMMKMNDITPSVQQHLVSVYAALACTVLAAALGSAAHVAFNLGGTLSLVATIGLMLWLGMDQDKTNVVKRGAILAGIGFCKGLTIGQLIEAVLMTDPSVLVVAFLGTTTIFACFSLAALFSKRRAYLYLGGVLSSVLSLMALLSIANIFLRSSTFFNLQLYAGLLLFCGYVVFDTQLIVEKASAGSRDFVWHALELFIDFMAIFVRLCVILARNAQQSQKKRSRD